MQEANTAAWARANRLVPEVRGSLVELNLRFLELAASRTCADEPGSPGLPAQLIEGVAALSAAQRAAAASCPYALFDLRFHDETFWQGRIADGVAWRVADEPGAAMRAAGNPGVSRLGATGRTEFVHVALFYAWHLAATAQLSARLILGMHARTAVAFGAMTVDRLPALALAEAAHLAPRWHHCPGFWQSLLQAATLDDETLLRKIHLYGIQLAAASQLPIRVR